jgi:uncharacterized protein (DUF927 family)
MLVGDGVDYQRLLADGRLELTPGRKARELLTRLLSTVKVSSRVRTVDRTGWHGQRFVLGSRSLGDGGSERLMLLPSLASRAAAYGTCGDLADWQRAIAAPCHSNTRLVLALSTAFAAPLLQPLGMESGGFHLRGASSIGKSTALFAAASVWGRGSVQGYVCNWRATDNGLEAVAAARCDTLLCLDELSQVEPRTAASTAYMLANGIGKARAGRSGETRAAQKWRLLFLSTGEIGLADKIAEEGRRRTATAGQAVRVVDIPADAGQGLGLFDTTHGAASGDAFARAIRGAAEQFYGTAGEAFLSRIIGQLGAVIGKARDLQRQFVESSCPVGADGQVSRVAARFGLVAAAGELATDFGIVPWTNGDAWAAADACFQGWLSERGGIGSHETTAGVQQVVDFLCRHGSSRFEPWPLEGVIVDHRTPNRVGWRRKRPAGEGFEYLVTRDGFREMTAGFDHRLIAKALIEKGYLKPDGSGKSARSVKVPGHAQQRLYQLELEAAEED